MSQKTSSIDIGDIVAIASDSGKINLSTGIGMVTSINGVTITITLADGTLVTVADCMLLYKYSSILDNITKKGVELVERVEKGNTCNSK